MGIDKDSSKFLDTSGPAPMDVDRVKGDGKDPWGKKGGKTKDKGGGKYGKGKQPWNSGGKVRTPMQLDDRLIRMQKKFSSFEN